MEDNALMRMSAKWVAVCALNVVLAAIIQAAPLGEPVLTDRDRYEAYAEHLGDRAWFNRTDPVSGLRTLPDRIYPYRVLVPVALAQLPFDSGTRWRLYRWGATATAGVIVAATAHSLAGSMAAAVLASLLSQGSFGFAFTAYDPYSPDPFVFVCLALMAWCWLHDAWPLAFAIGAIGLLGKETVVLMSGATALASLIPPRRRSWPLWFAQGPSLLALLLMFRLSFDEYVGWGHNLADGQLIQNSLTGGGWLALWMQGNPVPNQLFLIFAVFSVAWIFALVAVRHSPPDLLKLTIGAAAPFLALVYVQNPERALGNLFFVVVPLAVVTLSRVPFWMGLIAATLGTAISVRAATASDWLPASNATIPLAMLAAAGVLWTYSRTPLRNE